MQEVIPYLVLGIL